MITRGPGLPTKREGPQAPLTKPDPPRTKKKGGITTAAAQTYMGSIQKGSIKVKTKRSKKGENGEDATAVATAGDQGKSKMELLELEMRAKAIKSLLEKKVNNHCFWRKIYICNKVDVFSYCVE